MSRKAILGNRFHGLSLDIPRSFELLHHLGFQYDATYYPPKYGRPLHLQPFQAIDGLLEIPLTIRDRDYGELPLDDVWPRVKVLVDKVRDGGGVCTLSWHPHVFYDENNSFHNAFYRSFIHLGELYERILDHCLGQGAVFKTCAEVYEDFKNGGDSWFD